MLLALLDNSGVISMLQRRSADDKINVRKAALQVLEKIVKLEGDSFTLSVSKKYLVWITHQCNTLETLHTLLFHLRECNVECDERCRARAERAIGWFT